MLGSKKTYLPADKQRLSVNSAMSRRAFFTMISAGAMSGCADSPVLVNAYDALKFLALGLEGEEISRENINKIPYASISAKIGKGPRSMLVLGRKSGSELHWFSSDNAVIVTANGRIIKTAGFPENITNTVFGNPDPVNRQFHKKNFPEYSHRSIDIDTDQQFGIPVLSRYKVLGQREISISKIIIKTVLVQEYNISKTVNWNFINYYWVDIYDGFIWKSRQHISRSFSPIDIEILKPSS
jgi:hypothetical protein